MEEGNYKFVEIFSEEKYFLSLKFALVKIWRFWMFERETIKFWNEIIGISKKKVFILLLFLNKIWASYNFIMNVRLECKNIFAKIFVKISSL